MRVALAGAHPAEPLHKIAVHQLRREAKRIVDRRRDQPRERDEPEGGEGARLALGLREDVREGEEEGDVERGADVRRRVPLERVREGDVLRREVAPGGDVLGEAGEQPSLEEELVGLRGRRGGE